MLTPRERADIERMTVAANLEKVRRLVDQYEEGQAHFRQEIEAHKYKLGRLDERLGSGV